MCVKRKFTRSRISVGVISESRQIGGNWSVGNRSSILQKRLCVSNVIYTFPNFGRSDLRIATDWRELECRESELPPTEAVVCVKRDLHVPELG